jgi:hypothetical protein
MLILIDYNRRGSRFIGLFKERLRLIYYYGSLFLVEYGIIVKTLSILRSCA